MNEEKVTQAWSEYQRGVDYKQQINLYDTVDENYNFFWGDQWKGINAANLPTPVFNTIKPMVKFMVVQVKDRKLTLNFTAEGVFDSDQKKDVEAVVSQMSDYAKSTWNRLNMESKNLEGLENAAITGDYILYHWWDDTIETGQPFKGDINSKIIDNVNYYPGNPNDPDVQNQPYIILAFRELVENLKEQSKKNGLEYETIVQDEETEYTAGEQGKTEIDRHGKCTVLLKMWKENGVVMFAKYTRTATVQKPTNAKIRLYPVSIMNWTKQKNCCHGVAEVTYNKTNQVYINKQMAFTQLYLLQTAYPKVLYDKNAISAWTNKVAGAIGVNAVNGTVEGVARYMSPPQIPFDVWKGAEFTISNMMQLAGANDAALGNITNPDNTSAFIAIREASVVPLQSQEERFRQMMREMGLIWFEFWLNYYPENRTISFDYMGEREQVNFELEKYKDLVFDAKIEVGESAMWSEITTVQTLDKLLQAGVIMLSDYLEALPDGYIPNKTKLLTKIKQREQEAAMQQEAQQEAQQEQGGEFPFIPEESGGEI